jgi:hypothetical protein
MGLFSAMLPSRGYWSRTSSWFWSNELRQEKEWTTALAHLGWSLNRCDFVFPFFFLFDSPLSSPLFKTFRYMILDAKKIICYIPCYVLFFLSLSLQAGLGFSNGQGEKIKNYHHQIFNYTSFLFGKSKNTKATTKKHTLFGG